MNHQIPYSSVYAERFQAPSNTNVLLSTSFNFKVLRTQILVLFVLLNGLLGHAQTTCTAIAPAAPSVVTNRITSVSINWTPVAGAVSYRIEIKENTGTIWKTYNTMGTMYSFTNLNLGVSHSVRIYSLCNANVLSLPSPIRTFTPVACETTVATAPLVNPLTSTSVEVTLAFVAGLVKYRLEYKTKTATTWSSFTHDNTETHTYLSGLKAETAYNMRVSIICNGSVGSPSPITNFTTLPCVVTLFNTVRAIDITATKAWVSWTTVPGSISCLVEYKANTATTWKKLNQDTICYLDGLIPATLYNVRVSVTVLCSGVVSTVVSPIVNFTTLGLRLSTQSTLDKDAPKLIVAPNPNNGRFRLNYEAAIGELADIDIVDVTGKVVHREKTQLLTGENNITLQNILTQGMYWVRLKTPTFYITERVIVVK
jgi:Secretion system C-terminal sorting domain/Fibronectin type III domain